MKKSTVLIIAFLTTVMVTILKSTNIIDFSWWFVAILMVLTIYLAVEDFLFKKEKETKHVRPVIQSEHKSEFMRKLQAAMEESKNEFTGIDEFGDGKPYKSKFMQRLEKEMENKNKNKNK